jgi:hypothetical protein
MKKTIVDTAIEFICKSTKYTPAQCYRVVELISKYGEKTFYHCTKKQKEILKYLLYLLTPEENNG